MPAEFAIDFFHSKGKKSIYCSPIKSLSNQKFYDFTQKYPHISIGLITGDIKTNPDADVLIMTTEILLNKLYQLKSTSSIPTSSISFDMDIQNELGCVVFDEIHMINDENRGHVWEQTIMMLPPNLNHYRLWNQASLHTTSMIVRPNQNHGRFMKQNSGHKTIMMSLFKHNA
jgi:antiviral helicase SKI2